MTRTDKCISVTPYRRVSVYAHQRFCASAPYSPARRRKRTSALALQADPSKGLTVAQVREHLAQKHCEPEGKA